MLDDVVLLQVPFLGEGLSSNLAGVGFDVFVHADVVEQVPGFCELFVALLVLADVRNAESSQRWIPDFDFLVSERLEEFLVDLFFRNVRVANFGYLLQLLVSFEVLGSEVIINFG